MANLLNVNVDSLFEQHSVSEIDIVQKKIQTVIEEKREEIRTMVGESYRDLLKAADTIAAMQDSSGKLVEQIEAIQQNCRNLQEHQLLGFTSDDSGAAMARHRNANKQMSQYFGVMVQIKLLTALPELIWSDIDMEHFYTATELFIFSRHISTGLQLDSQSPVMRNLPVAKKQWEILKPFHVTIKQSVVQALQREDLSAEVAVDGLLSLLLLEKGNINEVLRTFLQLRCKAFLASLSEGSDTRRVKDKILASLRVLNGTIDLFGKCFVENGLLHQKMEELSDPNALPTIALMDNNDAQFAYMLPDIIANFRPKLEKQTLDREQVHSSLQEWLADTSRIGQTQLKQLFELVSTMSVIQDIKREANNYKNSLDFGRIKERFSLQNSLDFYELQYKPLINQRIRDIIQNSWKLTMSRTYESLEKALNAGERCEENLWIEQANDLPLSLEHALSDDHKIKQLLMKTKGYSTDVLAICSQFDEQLSSIISEMTVLIEEPTALKQDKLNLIEFLTDTSQEHLNEFLGKLKAVQLQAHQRRELLLVVRACVALVELSPNLKVCFCQQSKWRQCIGDFEASKGLDRWQRICQLIEDETYHYWLLFVDGILEQNSCKAYMAIEMSHEVVLEDFAMWETLSLEQQDEQDNTIHSTFRIPSQPRISLQLYLAALIAQLNEWVPQTLPAKVLQGFNNKLLSNLLDHYELLASHTATSQNVALQLYFDLRFVHNIFMVSRDERTICERFAALQSQFKDIIDPFDFELFFDQINANVKRAVSRLNYEFGVLTPQAMALMGVAGAPNTNATANAQEKEPNVLSLSSCGSTTLWFPLLPIVTQNVHEAKKAEMEKSSTMQTRKPQPTVSSRSKNDTTTTTTSTTSTSTTTTTKAKSGAASFFGAMSQEWFR